MQALSNTLVLPRDQTKHCFRHWEKLSSSIPPVSISPKPLFPQESTSPGSIRLGILQQSCIAWELAVLRGQNSQSGPAAGGAAQTGSTGSCSTERTKAWKSSCTGML